MPLHVYCYCCRTTYCSYNPCKHSSLFHCLHLSPSPVSADARKNQPPIKKQPRKAQTMMVQSTETPVFRSTPPPYLLLGATSETGRILARHLSTSRRHLISDQQLSCAPQVGKNCQGLGFGYLCRGYLQGGRRLQPRGTTPGMQISCWLRSLRLQRGAKYFHMPHKALLTDTASPSQHMTPSLTMSSNEPRICPRATSWHLLYRDFSLEFEIPGHVLTDFLSEHH